MFATSKLIRYFKTTFDIEIYLNLKTILTNRIYNAIIFTLKLKITSFYFLSKFLKSTILALYIKARYITFKIFKINYKDYNKIFNIYLIRFITTIAFLNFSK